MKKETAISEGGQFLPYDKSYEIEEKNFNIGTVLLHFYSHLTVNAMVASNSYV